MEPVATNTTWTGTMNITGDLTIAAGVTVTVDPGTTVTFSPGASVTVAGILDVKGTKAMPVTIGPATAGGFHSGFAVPAGGHVKLTYAKQTGGGITIQGGTATILDTYMAKASGDFLVMNGGAIDMQYSQVGMNVGETDSTHCDIHVGGMPTIKITNSNISTTPYGIMFYGGTNADFKNNNWFGNTKDVDTSAGVQGDFSGGWFEDTPPPAAGSGGATLVLSNLSNTRLLTAGPR